MNKENKTGRESFYFSHDYGARNDPKILELRAEYGLEGLGLYWCIAETLAEADNGYINPKLLAGLSIGYGVTKAKLQEYIGFMIEIELLREDEKGYYSKRMMDHKKIRKRYSEAGKKGAESRWTNRGAIAGLCDGYSTPNAKERKGKERKEKDNTNTNTVCVFNFRKSLLDYGFKKELVDEWLTIRKKKKAVNSQFSFNSFISQIERTGAEKNEVLRTIAEKQWVGFNHAWLKEKNNTRNNNINSIENEADRRNRESAKRKQEIYEYAQSVGMVGGEEKRDPAEVW